jgi:hypothetical protein
MDNVDCDKVNSEYVDAPYSCYCGHIVKNKDGTVEWVEELLTDDGDVIDGRR